MIDRLLAHADAAIERLSAAALELAHAGTWSDRGVDAFLLLATVPLRLPKVRRARVHLDAARAELDALQRAAAGDARAGAVVDFWLVRGVVREWIVLDVALPMRPQREALQAIVDDVHDLQDQLRAQSSIDR